MTIQLYCSYDRAGMTPGRFWTSKEDGDEIGVIRVFQYHLDQFGPTHAPYITLQTAAGKMIPLPDEVGGRVDLTA